MCPLARGIEAPFEDVQADLDRAGDVAVLRPLLEGPRVDQDGAITLLVVRLLSGDALEGSASLLEQIVHRLRHRSQWPPHMQFPPHPQPPPADSELRVPPEVTAANIEIRRRTWSDEHEGHPGASSPMERRCSNSDPHEEHSYS
jgi:hypothetical protein